MPPRTMTNFRIDPDLLAALREVRRRDGVPISEQIRRAVREYVMRKGVLTPAKPAGGRVRR